VRGHELYSHFDQKPRPLDHAAVVEIVSDPLADENAVEGIDVADADDDEDALAPRSFRAGGSAPCAT
jgi:hypothetical protein